MHVHRSRSCPPLTGIAKIIDWKADIAQSKAVSCIITHSEAENSKIAQAQEEKADSEITSQGLESTASTATSTKTAVCCGDPLSRHHRPCAATATARTVAITVQTWEGAQAYAH